MSAWSVICPYCQHLATLVQGRVLYPNRPDLHGRHFWRCEPCDAHVGCHQAGHRQGDGTKPLGRLANADLRVAKRLAHAMFDPLWQSGRMKRRDAYSWLADALGIPTSETHIGMFDLQRCRAVVAAVSAFNANQSTGRPTP